MNKLSFSPHFMCSFTALGPVNHAMSKPSYVYVMLTCLCVFPDNTYYTDKLSRPCDLYLVLQKLLFKRETTLYCLCSQPRRIQGIATHFVNFLFLKHSWVQSFQSTGALVWFHYSGAETNNLAKDSEAYSRILCLLVAYWVWINKQTNNILICLISFGVNYNRLPRTAASQVLSISKDWSSTTSLENQFQCLTSIILKIMVMFKSNFQHISSCLLPVAFW